MKLETVKSINPSVGKKAKTKFDARKKIENKPEVRY